MTNPYTAPQAALSEAVALDETYQPEAFSFSGRIGRVRYLGYYMGASLLTVVAAVLASFFMVASKGLGFTLLAVVYIAMLVMMVALMRRRLNDLGKSGWFGLLCLVPLVNIGLGLWLMFGKGDEGSNDFGPAPKANSTGVIILACIVPVFLIAMIGIMAAVAIPAYNDYVQKAKVAQAQQQMDEMQDEIQNTEEQQAPEDVQVEQPAADAQAEQPAAQPAQAQ